MTNAILLYTGNVGSTPTIEYVQSSGKVVVPVVEQFDEYLLEKHVEGKEVLFPFLTEILSEFYEGRLHPYLLKPDLKTRNENVVLAPGTHTFFKWRPFDETREGAADFSALMTRYDVRPIVIRRRSLVDQAIKIHLSETTYGSRHQQFKAGTMGEDEYQTYLAEQAALRIHVDTAGVQDIITIATQFLRRTQRMIERRNAFFPKHAKGDIVVATEDLYTPYIDLERFNGLFSDLFGEPIEADIEGQILTRKAGLEVTNCTNYAEIVEQPRLRNIGEQYETIGWMR